MTLISRKEIEALAEFDSQGMPVISFYLNIDGELYPPHQNVVRARNLISEARAALPGKAWSDEAKASIKSDLDYIGSLTQSEFERKDLRGLAIFCCSARKLGTIHALQFPVQDSLTIETNPVIGPLAAVVCNGASYAVAAIDRVSARIFLVKDDHISPVEIIRDQVHARFHAGETEKHLERHIDGQLRKHLRHVACRLDELVNNENLSHAIVIANPELMHELFELLPPELSNKIKRYGHPLAIDLPESEILKRARAAYADQMNQEDRKLITMVKDIAACGGAAEVGTAPTLKALGNKAVTTLVVQRDHCAINPAIEEALRLALQQHAEIRFATGLSDCSLTGGIGALLHY